MKKPLVIVGGRGSAEIAMGVFEAANEAHEEWDLAGYLSDVCRPGEHLGGHPVLGGTDEAGNFAARGFFIHYALHLSAKKKWERVQRFRALNIPHEAQASAVHPRACLHPSTTLGPGVLVCALAGTSVEVHIGGNVHVYGGAFVGHETVVGDLATLAAHAVLGARIAAGEGCHIGLSSAVREDVHLGEYAVVGMGAIVLRDVAPFVIVAGNPAQPIGTVPHGTA